MWYVVVGVLCLAIGGAAVWHFLVKKAKAELSLCQINKGEVLKALQEEQTRTADLVGAAESIYFTAFSGVGTHPSVLVDACNKLWKLIGKSEKGVPR